MTRPNDDGVEAALDRMLSEALRPDAADRSAAPRVLAAWRASRPGLLRSRTRERRTAWAVAAIAGALALVAVAVLPAPTTVDADALVRAYADAMSALPQGEP